MTENEATKTICPLTFAVPGAIAPGAQRGAGPFTCLGSGCQLWKWSEPKAEVAYAPRGDQAVTQVGRTKATKEPERPEWMTDHWRWDAVRALWTVGVPDAPDGRCGLVTPCETLRGAPK